MNALLLGLGATLIYNPVSATLQERAKQMEASFFARSENLQETAGFWLNQVASDGQTIINARNSQQRGTVLTGLTVFRFNTEGRFVERIEASEAVLEPGFWVLKGVRRFMLELPRIEQETFRIATNLSAEQVLGRFATPDSVPFWELPKYIESSVKSGSSGAGYRLQFHKLLAQPFLLAAMVLLASATSLKSIRLGGVQKLVLGGVIAGFLMFCRKRLRLEQSRADASFHCRLASDRCRQLHGCSGALASGGRIVVPVFRNSRNRVVTRERGLLARAIGLALGCGC